MNPQHTTLEGIRYQNTHAQCLDISNDISHPPAQEICNIDSHIWSRHSVRTDVWGVQGELLHNIRRWKSSSRPCEHVGAQGFAGIGREHRQECSVCVFLHFDGFIRREKLGNIHNHRGWCRARRCVREHLEDRWIGTCRARKTHEEADTLVGFRRSSAHLCRNPAFFNQG